jgi:hypothetical protein
MNTLIFSKNRPAQLELCLRSHQKFWDKPIKVLYKSDKEFESGYEKVREMYPKVEFLEEYNFKKQVCEALQAPYSVFFCDDDVMIRKFDENCPEFQEFKKNDDILCLSLRLARNYDYCFDSDKKVEIPKFINGMWEWFHYPLDWGYPMSVLGHIFRTSELKPLVERLNFKSPNTFEGIMAQHPIPKPLMIGFKEAKNINLPMNLVQNEALNNRAGDTDIYELNKKFLEGYVIDLDDIIKQAKKARSCFFTPVFKWRSK